MGRGTIVSGGADGLYQVTIERDTTRADEALANRQAAKLDADQDVIDWIGLRDAAKADLDAAADALNQAIDNYIPGETSVDPVTEATVAAREAQFAYADAKTGLQLAYVRRAAIQQDINAKEGIPDDPTIDAWCADLTEDLAPGTDVGTIAPNDEESTATRIIRPAYDPGTGSRATYDAARDGQFQPVASTTPAGFMYNSAMLPGCQKWLPQYRIGTVIAVDQAADTVDVELDNATASGALPQWDQNLDINQTQALLAVPVEYLFCNAQAFEVDDRVVIEFNRDWNERKVIGFESNPKPCALAGLFATVNDPLAQATYNEAAFRYVTNAWEVAEIPDKVYNIRWESASGAIVSWRGNRIGDAGYRKPFGTGQSPTRFTSTIWYNRQSYTAPGQVLGAALRTVDGEPLLLAVTIGNSADNFYSYSFTTKAWQLRGSWLHQPNQFDHDVGVRFNQSGTECAFITVIEDSSTEWTYRVYKTDWTDIDNPFTLQQTSATTHRNTRGGSVTVAKTPNPIPNVPDNDTLTCNASSSHTDTWDYPVAVSYNGDTLIVANIVGSAASSMTGDFSRTISESDGAFGRDKYAASGSAGGTYTLEIKLQWNTPSGFEEIVLEKHTETRNASFVSAWEELEVPGTGGLKRIYNYSPENGTQDTYKLHTDIVWLDLRANLCVVFEQIIDESLTTSGSRWINYDPWMVTGAPREITTTIVGDATTQCKIYPAGTVAGTWINDRNSVNSYWASAGFFGLIVDELTDPLEMVEEASALSPGYFGVDLPDDVGTINFIAPPTDPQISRKRDNGSVWPMTERTNTPNVAADRVNRVLLSVNLQQWITEPYFPTVTPFNYLTNGDPVALVGGSAETQFVVHGFGV